MSLRPQVLVGFPSDPPPHEGAMIDVPIILEPPDIIDVEVLEALPGRPITGERLIRQDGTISLGFYGDVHVRGLTPEQAKVKILLHLRHLLPDALLGLVNWVSTGDENAPGMLPDPEMPPDLTPDQPATPAPTKPNQVEPPPPSSARTTSPRHDSLVTFRSPSNQKPLVRVVSQQIEGDDVAEAFRKRPRDTFPAIEDGRAALIEPQNSVRVFVEIAAYNSKVYFVQGDVGSPGRLPITGKETVLDALNYAGGLIPTAEPTDIHLYRPARGDQPTSDYLIDLAAILKGEAKANLQIFPDDRLVIGRNKIVQKTIEIDRAGTLMHSVFNNYNYRNIAVRSVNPNQGNIDSISLPDWFETIWTEFAANPATLKDPEKFRESITRLLERTGPKQ